MASGSSQVRRRPPRAKLVDPLRNSNVVRASVLETALELGFGQSSTVADWIFNNPLSEEAEDFHPEPHIQAKLDTEPEPAPYVAEAMTPTLTSGSNSTSDESSSLHSPANNAPNAAIATIQAHSHKPSVTEPPQVHFGDFPSDQLQLFSPFTLSPHDTHRLAPGGNLGKLPGGTERSRSQDDSLESPIPGSSDTGYTSEGQYLSKGKKDKLGKFKSRKVSKPKTPDSSKTSEKDADYASDGGYLSASSHKSQGKSPGRVKSRAMAFFRRRPKKSARASDDEDEDVIPPVPAIPILPRPSSPKPLECRAVPSSPTRSGFTPLTLNLTSPPASPRRQASRSPPFVRVRAVSSQRLDQHPVPQGISSPLVSSAPSPTVSVPVANAATNPTPPSMPGTPLSTASFPTGSSSMIQNAGGASKSLMPASSRQHLCIPPPAPPPTLPLPQPPSVVTGGLLPSLPVTPTTPSRKGAPIRPIPVVPTAPGSTRPLTPHRTPSPFRPLLSPRTLPTAVSYTRASEFPLISGVDQPNSKVPTGRQRSGTAGLGSTPAFLQRRIQHCPPPSPWQLPTDVPLPPSPCLTPNVRPRTPIGSPSKFHEHFSSVSSVPSSQVLSTLASKSPSLSATALSESSSGPSVRSSHISSASERSQERANYLPGNALDYSRPTTSASTLSGSSYGQPIPSTFNRPATDLRSHFSDRSDVNSSVYSVAMQRDSGSVTTFDADDADIDDVAPKGCIDEDDDASIYTSDDKTAGRQTMYLVEHGELNGNGDEVVISGSHYWGGYKVPPPLPPLPPMPARPGPGYF